MSGNNTTTTIHSTTTMEFPRDRQDAIQRKVDARTASTAHFPNQTGMPGAVKRPMMQPVLDPSQMPQSPPPQQPPRAPIQNMQPSFQPPPVAHQPYQQPPMQAPISVPSVPNEMPGFTNAVADPEGTSLALPSRFAFYGFKDLYVMPFRAKHMAKLQRAHREQSLLPMVEAVSSVLSTTTEGYNAVGFDLSLADFYFVLYWLRMNSFTKSNYTHRTQCENPAHLKRVEDGYRLEEYQQQVAAGEMTQEEYTTIAGAVLPESSLDIAEIIRNSDVKVTELETVPDPEVYHFSDTSKMFFRPPTMRDVIEFQDAPEMAKKETRTEFAYLAQMASHIQHREFMLDLATRVKIVEEASADQVILLQDFEKAVSNYGVDEHVVVTCKGCGASRKSKLILDAFSFLSPDQRD